MNQAGAPAIRPASGDIGIGAHGPATPGVLSDDAYRDRFGTANPNSDLITALEGVSVSLHVCSYALANARIDPAAVNPGWSIDVAAMVTIVNFMMDGWTLLAP